MITHLFYKTTNQKYETKDGNKCISRIKSGGVEVLVENMRGEQEQLEKGLHEGGQLDVPEAESPTVVGSQGHLHLKVHTDPTIYCWLNTTGDDDELLK